MNDHLSDVAILTMFGGICVWCMTLSVAYLGMLRKQDRAQIAIDLFIDTLGEKIAKALHNADDHLYLDDILNKYLNEHYELSYPEWQELKQRCNANNTNQGFRRYKHTVLC